MKLLSLSARWGLSRAILLVSALAVVAAGTLGVPLLRAQDDPVVARVNGTPVVIGTMACALGEPQST